jgi:LuxR family transcriptional regulator, maltose regulon positive regulatory protein
VRALALAESDGFLLPFLLHPTKDLLERRARHRTTHAALVTEIHGMLTGQSRPHASREGLREIVPPRTPEPLLESLSDSEVRVLRYLPTNLTTPEIARELSVSTNTVKTHIRHLYAKFGTHHRSETVESARALGLLAPRGIARPARA